MTPSKMSVAFSSMPAGGAPTYGIEGQKNRRVDDERGAPVTLDVLIARRGGRGTTPQVRGYGNDCFQVNETLVHGSVILLPTTFLMWKVNSVEDITIENLSYFSSFTRASKCCSWAWGTRCLDQESGN